jgi:sugar lactone lactonase YvrE
MPRLKLGVVCLAMLFSGLTLAHAKDPYAKTRVFVPDTGNNRVLVFNDPTSSNQAADAVLGQTDPNTSTAGTSATELAGPTAFVVDEDGDLIVSDTGNCRLLLFHPPFTTGEAASAVLGKPDFNTPCGSLTPSAANLGGTGGVAIDESGNLWVADSANNRVLHFKSPFKTGKAADIVLGQPDFVSNTCPATPTAGTLCYPVGVASDSDDILWVVDMGDNRVLGYKSPKKKMNANVELGHPKGPAAFTSNAGNDGGISASTFGMPTGIALDSKDHMWVVDTGNSRILMFKPDFNTGNAATLVLGQPDFVSAYANQNSYGGPPTVATLYYPQGIFTQKATAVWIGDTSNNRTLQFVSPYTSGMSASLVLGQPDFNSYSANEGGSPSDQSELAPFNTVASLYAGPSWLALAVLVSLIGGWMLMTHLRRKAKASAQPV